MTPYPQQPGFGRRVAYAEATLKAFAEGRGGYFCRVGNEWRERVHDRPMDNCFEMNDGDAVVWELMRRARTDETLRRGIVKLTGNAHCLAAWEKTAAYCGPQMTLAL